MDLQDELFGIPHRAVMDPVHGGIPFFPHEAAMIDHPLFQRLRFVIQNDITSLVFPGTTHTRFQHSIGAMHIAGRFVKALLRSYLSDPQNDRKRPLSEEQAASVRYFYYCLRLAALLHDCGHFPFSHQFETSDPVRRILGNRELFRKLWKGESWKTYYKGAPAKLDHEHYSVRIAHEILKSQPPIPGIQVQDVLGIMETTSCVSSEQFNDAALQLLSVLLRDPADREALQPQEAGEALKSFFQTIISGELDIDKMDYLLRDSFFSGSKYGTYNLDHLLNTLRIGFTKQPRWVGLAITEKGIGAFEDFVHSRFQLYQQIYSHKTVVGFKWLLKTAMNDILAEAQTRREVRLALSEINAFRHFTDMFFWERFRAASGKRAGSASCRLINRKPLKYLQTGHDLSQFRKSQTVQHLESELKVQPEFRNARPRVIYYESPIKFSKVAHPSFEKVRVLVRAPISKRRSLHEIKEKTRFFEKFHDIEITHFYIHPTF